LVLTQAIGHTGSTAPPQPLPVCTAALDVLLDSVLVTDADLSDAGPHIVYANPAFVRLTGWTIETVLGRSPRILQGVDTDRSILRAMWVRLAANQPWEGTAINYRADGTPFVMEWSIAPYPGWPERTTHFIAVQRDVTHRAEAGRALEAALIARRQAEQARTDFVAMMTHELREPLCAIVVLADLVESHAGDVSRKLRQVGTDLVANLDLILDYSRSAVGGLALGMVDVDLRFVVESCLRHMSGRAQAARVNLRLHDGPPAQIIADELRLRQAFTNLFDNAIKCCAAGGTVQVMLAEDPQSYRVVLLNNGARSFDAAGPYAGGDLDLPPYGDIGLDLAIARRFIEMHGGAITLKVGAGQAEGPSDGSKEGRPPDGPSENHGTQATVMLPRATPRVAGQGAARDRSET